MAFTIPNQAAASFSNQARVDSGDVVTLVQGLKGDGVIAGCAVTAQGSPDMTLAVAAGAVRLAGKVVAVSAGNVTVTSNASGSTRIDLVVVNSAGTKSVLAGTAGALPLWPAHTTAEGAGANYVVLARVEVPTGVSAITNGHLTAKDVVLPAGAVVNVKDFGATGDGTTNDSTFVTAAVAALPSGGGTLYFPPGTYIMPISGLAPVSGMPSNSIVQGAGPGATVLKAETGTVTAGGAMIRSATGTYPYNMTVRDLTVQGPGGAGGFVIAAVEHLGGSSGALKVENCRFTGTWATTTVPNGTVVVDGPYAGNGNASVIDLAVDRCEFALTAGTGVIHAGQVGSKLKARDCRFTTFGIAGSNLDHGLYIYHDVETLVAGCRFDTNNSGTSGGFGIQFYGGTAVSTPRKVVDCHFASTSYFGIVCPSTGRLEIVNCSFEAPPASSASFTGFNGGQIEINGCHFKGTGGRVWWDQQTTGSLAWFNRCTFEGNSVSSLFIAALAASKVRFTACEFTALASTVVLVTLSNGATAWQDRCIFNNITFPSSGTTAQRPPAPQAGIGGMWYDTTLNSPIWSSGAGTTWRNGIGTSV